MSTSYGTISTLGQNQKVTYSSQLGNGTSSVNTAGTIVVEFDTLWSNVLDGSAFITQFTPYASPFENFILVNQEAKMMPQGLARMTFTYQAGYTATPATQYTESAGRIDEDIQNHPDFDTFVSNGWVLYDDDGNFTGFTAASGMAGQDSYVVGTRCVTVKEYFTSEPTDNFANIGCTSNPGRDYTGTTNWLIIATYRALEGTFWTRTTVYQYSANEWNSNIYSAA